MNFSGINIFRDVLQATNNFPGAKGTENFIKVGGGGFSPNLQETLTIMRAQMDYQWEPALVSKYRALMVNRLNRLKQDLRNSYTNLLHVAATQQVYHGAASSDAAAATDSFGKKIDGDDAYFGLYRYSDSYDGANNSDMDGINSFYRNWKGREVQFRQLEGTGAGLDLANNIKITFRTQEKPADIAGTLGLGELTSWMGEDPYAPNQKVAEYSVPLNTGGFWSTINYLYDFSPKNLKYSYVSAYSVNTDEAGTRDIGTTHTTLFQQKLTDGRDNDASECAVGPLNSTNVGKRIKWVSMNPSDGYTTEVSGTTNSFKIWDRMSGTHKDNDIQKYNRGQYAGQNVFSQSGTFIDLDGTVWECQWAVDPSSNHEESGSGGLPDRWAYRTFLNHYEVITNTIAFESGSLAHTEDYRQSHGYDGSLDLKVVSGSDGVWNIAMAGSGKIGRFFTNQFIKNQFTIEQFNKYSDSFSNSADPIFGNIELRQYESKLRAFAMSSQGPNSFKDQFNISSASGSTMSEDEKKVEINSGKTFATDWHYIQSKTADQMWFPYIPNTVFEENGSYSNQTVNFRKTFKLELSDLYDTAPDFSCYDGFKYVPRGGGTMNVKLSTRNGDTAHLVVNGQVVGSTTSSTTLNIFPYLRAGENIIGIQVSTTSGNEFVSLTDAGGNDPYLENIINTVITTDTTAVADEIVGSRWDNGKSSASNWQAQIIPYTNGVNPISGTGTSFATINYSGIDSTGTVYKRVNSFEEIIMEALNKYEYEDIFRLGLFKNIRLDAVVNTPAGGQASGVVTLNFDPKTRKVILVQDKWAAKGAEK